MDGFEIRELRYFVAVAEERNFSRAAERLGMAQPPLSRAIRQLERRLGAELFQRSTRQVALTDVGAAILNEARYVLDAVAGLGRRAARAAQATPTLVATAKPGIATGMLRRVIDAYASLPEALPVEIAVSGYREQADMVRDGRADVALLSSWFDPLGLDSEPLAAEPRVAALPAGHPLAEKPELHCADLHGEPMPQWPDETEGERAYWSGRDREFAHGRSGISDQLAGPVVADPGQLIEVVALGQAVALVPEHLAQANPRPDVAYRPVVDASPYVVAVAWSAGSRSSHLSRFVRAATELHQFDSAAA